MKNMKSVAHRAASLCLIFTFLIGCTGLADAQTRRRYPRRTVTRAPRYTVNRNQVIKVRMNENITSENARIGDRFTTTVTEPVYAGDSNTQVIPANSIITGTVTSVQRAARNRPGIIAVKFTRVELPNGRRYLINGSLTDLQSANTGLLGTGGGSRSDREGTVQGGSSTRKKVVFIGGGAAAGAIIGAIAGGGKGAGIGAIVGGGLGVAGALLDKGEQAEVKRGQEFGVILNQPLSLPAWINPATPAPQ
jgi:hypothetical protein